MATPKSNSSSKPAAKKPTTSSVLQFLDGAVSSSEAAPITGPPTLLDEGLGVRSMPSSSQSSFSPGAKRVALSSTAIAPLLHTSRDPYVRRFIGASKHPSVPAVLSDRAIVTSWSSSIPWQPASSLSAANYYSIPRSVPDAMAFVEETHLESKKVNGVEVLVSVPNFTSFPLQADLSAYLKAVAAVRSGTYSQTPRLDGMPGISVPLIPIAGELGAVTYPVTMVSLSDTIAFDPMGAAQLAPRLSPRLSSADSAARMAWNGQLDPLNEVNPLVSGMLPYGSAYGLLQTILENDIAGTANLNAPLETIRQLCTSPILRLSAAPRPVSRPQLGLVITTPSYDWSPVPADKAEAFTPSGSDGSRGLGGISVRISFSLIDETTGVTQDYPPIDFAVNFDTTGNEGLPSFVIPRGKNIANVFHPGFTLLDGQTKPINIVPSSFYSYTLSMSFLTWGVANNCSWGLGMSNPASRVFSDLDS